MADKLRVHTLSKELGVTSKAILEKCRLEGVEGVTNHMSTISAGLAETIREWFSGHSGSTAVEEAEKVDLEKVRAKRRSPRKKEPEKGPAEEAPQEEAVAVSQEQPAVAVAEPPPPAPPAETTAAAAATLVAEPEVQQAAPPVTVEPEPTPPVVVAEAPAAAPPSPPPRPEPVKPAGPQNVPAPAQMKGPRVVGFAKPDPVTRPVPRSAPRRPGPPLPEPPAAPSSPIRRGGKKGPATVDEDTRKLRAKLNPRRSRSSMAEVGERLREWRDRDVLERQERLQEATGQGIHARRAREKPADRAVPRAPSGPKTKAQVTEPIVAHELCAATGIGLAQLFPKFKNEHNLLLNRNTIIPTELAEMVMLDFGIELEIIKPRNALDILREEYAALPRNNLQKRPPIVTVLGHVDHGKTSLLDAIRKTSVAAGEAGGITQHIGAYHVEREGISVTFLDTPGHAAFTAMRARGAHMTDVVVLVVAADDGVMPQTIEAINHAKAAKVAIVVALNKIDLPGIDINKVYGQLAEHGLVPSDWGGDIDVIKTSAVRGDGIDELLSHLTTLTDLLDLKADPTIPASGVVVEAEMKPGVGPVARVLVKEGTLRQGDFLVCGPAAGRVRVLRDDRGRVLKSAGPAMPVEVGGLETVPNAGDMFYVVESMQRAKEVADVVANERRSQQMVQVSRRIQTLDDLFKQRQAGQIPELNLILRADVQGSVDALYKMLNEIPSEEVKLNFLHTGIGSVTESDVVLARASGAMIVGFNVSVEPGAQKEAELHGVDIRLYRIIYEVADDIRKALEGLLPRARTEEFRGRATVREIFHITRVGTIAGCMVVEGIVGRSHMVRVIRDGQIIVPTAEDAKRGRHRSIASLRRFKDDVREVRAGLECGLRIEDFDDLKPGDVIETYEVVETARTLS